MIYARTKILFLYVCKYLGLFKLARFATRKQFRILCYHGFAFSDEYLFRPKLFMRPETLAKRLAYIAEVGFQVYPLTSLLALKGDNRIPKYSLAITVDDGWNGLYELAQPLFKAFQFPWTLFLTTYYLDKKTQVADVAIQYLVWKTPLKVIDLQDIAPGTEGTVELYDEGQKIKVSEYLYDYCLGLESSEQRQRFINRLAECLDVDWQPKLDIGQFFLSSAEDIRRLVKDKVDIQLHTHRHSLPDTSRADMAAEIEDNRRQIKSICGIEANHLCYPSGYYTKTQIEWLEACGISSAVTCHPGLNDSDTPVLRLKRFLDGEDIHAIEFEAEISGFKHLLHRLLGS